MTKGIDYDVWAHSPSLGQDRWPKNPRSAINEQEAADQAAELIEELKTETGVSDWQGKWKLVEFDV